MRAARFSSVGGPEVVEVVEVPEPIPGPGQVRLAVRAAGVNPSDWKRIQGLFGPPELPGGAGIELAGVIDSAGGEQEGLGVGDEVLGASSGPAFAELALADPARLVPRPPDLPWEVAGGLAVAAGTGLRTLELLGVEPGQTLLVLAASGAVGMVAAQLALARGATVIGTGSAAAGEFLESVGVTPVRYGDGLAERVRGVVPHGVDRVLDASGHGELAIAVELAGGPEHVLTIAAGDAAEHGVRFHGGGGGARTPDALREVVRLIGEGRLRLPIAASFPLDRVAEALAQSRDGHPLGKLVVLP